MNQLGREINKPYWKVLTDVSDLVKKLEKKWKNHYNVYTYNVPIYPPKKSDKLEFTPNLLLKN